MPRLTPHAPDPAGSQTRAPMRSQTHARPALANLTACLALVCLAVLRLAPPAGYALLPPCPIHRYLHLLCPGCGGTRACIALLHGHLAQAWHLNALLLLLAPLLALYAATALHRLRRGVREALPPVHPAAISALLSATALFTLARNLPH